MVVFRCNQAGYLAQESKKIFLLGQGGEFLSGTGFTIRNSSKDLVFFGKVDGVCSCAVGDFKICGVCDFSPLSSQGEYVLELETGDCTSSFAVFAKDTYSQCLKALLSFYHSQRCGDDTPLHGACHLHDGLPGIDLTGGWHDAGDYMKFVITTAFTCIEMLTPLSVLSNTSSATVKSLRREARVGILWLLKMTARAPMDELFYQVGHEKDHRFWRLPEEDKQSLVDLRTVYRGWGKNLNGLVVAVFAMAARLYAEEDLVLAEHCRERACLLWEKHDSFPDIQNTTPTDFYERSISVDATVYAAVQLYLLNKKGAERDCVDKLLKDVDTCDISWQNIGFLCLVGAYEAGIQKDFCRAHMAEHIERIATRAETNPFRRSAPLVWGSCAHFGADAQKILLYEHVTNDTAYHSYALDQINYLLGTNPWGISFVVGVGDEYPRHAHSQLNDLAGLNTGAVVGGPAEKKDWDRILRLPDHFSDPYGAYQGDEVYYDCVIDYYTNEVALDYAAPLLAALAILGQDES
jgi:hypothetical protein